MDSIDKRKILEVDVGNDNNSFYRALYGALKYYVDSNNNTNDRSLAVYEWFKLRPEEGKSLASSIKENVFIQDLRNYLSSTIKQYAEKAITFKDLYNNVRNKYNESELDNVYGSHKAFQTQYRPDEDGDFTSAENKFYVDLGEKVRSGFKLTKIEIVALLALLKDAGYIINFTKPQQNRDLTNITSSRANIYITKSNDKYSYFTLTDSQNIQIGEPVVIAPIISEAVMEKNSQPVYNFNKIYDTVDYFKLGVNRHNQFLSKYNLEKEIYKNKNLNTQIQNVEMHLQSATLELIYKIDQKSLDIMKMNERIYKQILDMNIKNTTKLIEKSQEVSEQIMIFLQEGIKRLSYTATENLRILLLELHKGIQSQAFTLQKLNLDREIMSIDSFLNIQKSLRTNSEIIEGKLFEIQKTQVEGFGAIKDNVEMVSGEIKAVTKVGEAVNPLILSTKNDIETEVVKLQAYIQKLERNIAEEGQKRERAIKAEQDMRDAQFNLERKIREGEDYKLYTTILQQKQLVHEQIKKEWEDSLRGQQIDKLTKDLLEAQQALQYLMQK